MDFSAVGVPADGGRYLEHESMEVDLDELGMIEEHTTDKVEVVFFNNFPDDFDDDDLA
jgi:hypothetical protein